MLHHALRAKGLIVPPGGGGYYSPPSTNLIADYDPGISANVTIATGVSDLASEGGSAGSIVQATGSKQPTIVSADLNGYDVLSFAAASQQSLKTTFTQSLPVTMFDVVRIASWQNTGVIHDGGVSTSALLCMYPSSPKIALYSGSWSAGENWPAADTWMVVMALHGGASTSYIRYDDAAAVSQADGPLTQFGGVTYGARGAQDTFFSTFKLARSLIYSGAMSGGDQDTIIAGLLDQYGL